MQIEFNTNFQKALQAMEHTNEHLFITGRAGTGKSTLLKFFSHHTAKNVVLLAPTGIAALNIGGQTIHSFFGFPAHPVYDKHIRKRKNKALFENIDALVIDEISMVRADLLDAIDRFMRLNGRMRNLPFGGSKVICIGDLYQLPPVISTKEEKQLLEYLYETPFFYSAHVLKEVNFNYIELKKIYRQTDGHFLNLLEAVRTNNLEQEDYMLLKSRHHPEFKPPKDSCYIVLTATNEQARLINEQEMNQLETPAQIYEGFIKGEFAREQLPCDYNLYLKEGAQVMFVKNDPYHRWVNGTIGRVYMLRPDVVGVEITTETGEIAQHLIPQTKWEIMRYVYNETEQKITTEILGSFTQYPLKLAYAITIHKSQGKTFEQVIIDLGRGAFAPGQVYVALSRCTSLAGIVLKRQIKYWDVKTDERIVEFTNLHKIYN